LVSLLDDEDMWEELIWTYLKSNRFWAQWGSKWSSPQNSL